MQKFLTLADFAPDHDRLIGIDSDGCVFDTMEIKQKQCFHPLIIEHWNLQPVAPLLREAAEFVNLYSTRRGRNRFLTLVDTFDFLRERPEVRAAGVDVPMLADVRAWIASGAALGNDELARTAEATGSRELAGVLAWSRAVNARIAEVVRGIAPFPGVRESLDRIRGRADLIVVSQTPREALLREWAEHGLAQEPAFIAGQEQGTKTEHLQQATRDRYPDAHVLMIGDAPGDLEAARDNGALFYPVNPGQEAASWKRFASEACERFFAGTYAGDYERERIAEFEALLPDTPPWRSPSS